ncbi:MAG: proline dehydrogenase family protein [Acidobacteriota bacterium]
MRRLLLFLSRRRGVQRWLENLPIARRVTARFIAGRKLDDALRLCERLNRGGVLVTLDHLGENVTSLAEAEGSRDAYLEALGRVAERGLRATVSIKLTQFGLDLSESACRRNVDALAREAARAGTSVEVDMETIDHVDRTLRLVVEMHQSHGNMRGVIQAYLRRSEADLEMLCSRGVPVRLCKGAYSEPAAVAFPRKREVNANFVRLMKILFDRGVDPGFATHDHRMIAEARRHARELGIPSDRYEFQMLYGIRRDLEKRLMRDGYRLRLYVPYGDAWYPYFMRRLAERPANLFFLLRNLLLHP